MKAEYVFHIDFDQYRRPQYYCAVKSTELQRWQYFSADVPLLKRSRRAPSC